MLAYPSLLFTTVSSLLGVGTVQNNNEDLTLPYVITSANIITAVLLTFSKFLKFGELSESHHQAYLNYTAMYRAMVFQLSQDKRNRKVADTYIDEVRTEVERLSTVSPTIPYGILRLHADNFGTDTFAGPEELTALGEEHVRTVEKLMFDTRDEPLTSVRKKFKKAVEELKHDSLRELYIDSQPKSPTESYTQGLSSEQEKETSQDTENSMADKY